MLSIALCIFSCKKLVEVQPPSNTLAENNVYQNDASAISVLTGLFNSMNAVEITNPVQGSGSITLFTGLSSDELALYGGVTNRVYQEYFHNALQVTVVPGSGFNHWAPLYKCIFKCNAAIEGIASSNGLTPVVKQQLLGEAKFMRAFFYFYLVNLFGDVPLVLTSDPRINALSSRMSKGQVYEQIITDLRDAVELLSADYLTASLLSATTERVRPTRWAAEALLARVYLYIGEYPKAEEHATKLIGNTSLFGLSALNKVFLKNSREAIWQLQPTAPNFNTVEARTLIIPYTGPNSVDNPVYISDNLIGAFELGDQRGVYGNWVDTISYKISTSDFDTVVFPYKYKINSSPGATTSSDMTEYFMVLRLGEQYLIRAEARAEQGNIAGAQEDLNDIRSRAGLANTTASDKTALLSAILHERQVELFCEWGHRWFDLKRTANVDAVMSIVTPEKAKGAPWQSYQKLYPLPLSDLQQAPNLIQNIGY
ncbi:hypothetical protein A4H97_22910 [Niastella yeongjuensis]|uniref:Carbohydrate-binding protein SusD n=2 Tax=Niastella yeongjuensis TaxID=354355 RepID=A0A1V9F7I0_9BACT|nr:hypothetical protein A4H97_22910 [Niastella yeongjuensis]